MLKYTRNSVIAFDFGEALSFTGETGPYLQYATLRARRILLKLEARNEQLPDFRSVLSREAMSRQLADEDCWQLLLAASKADFAVERAVTSGEPAHVARFAFDLAQGLQQPLPKIPRVRRTRPRKESLPAMDDRIFPHPAGTHIAGRAGN